MSRRAQRVGENMREVISELIQREVKDPRIGFLTITAVRMTPDLRHADIYLTVLDREMSDSTLEGLTSAARFLRGEAARRMNLRYAPEIAFKLDDAFDQGLRIDELLHEVHRIDHAHDLENASILLRAADVVAIACHVFPDGDALGSTLGLALGLKKLGKTVVAGWASSETYLPSQYSMLPSTNYLRPTDAFLTLDAETTTFVSLDCAAPDRLGDLESTFIGATRLLNVDHHVTNPRFGTHNLVDAKASSTSELVVGLLDAVGVEIDDDMATCLYTGILTDTGRLTYPITTPDTIRIAARLVELGANPSVISQTIWETKSVGYLKVLGEALRRITVEDDLIYTHISRADLETFGIVMEDTEEIIDVVRTSFEADVCCVFKETKEGPWKGSLRSRGDTDVSAVAKSLGGGGHPRASGFTSKTSDLETSIKELIAVL